MDGTKRKANRLPIPPSDPIDLGSTPPWALPVIYHEESALRFTPLPTPNHTINPTALHNNIVTYSSGAPNWTPVNLKPAAQALPRVRKQIGRRPLTVTAPATRDEDGDDELVCGVDTEDGHDSVYMLNAQEGSWSGPLESEDDPKVRAQLPDQAIQALEHLKRAQELYAQQELLADEDEAAEAEDDVSEIGSYSEEVTEDGNHRREGPDQVFATQDDYEAEKLKWHKDLLLRNVMRRIKTKLNNGAVITLERIDPINLTITCAHPHCPAPEHRMPPGAYYVILGQPRQLESAERFCLFCLEWLWNGKGMCKPLPAPEATPSTGSTELKVSSLNLDGAMDDERLVAAGGDVGSTTTGTPTTSRFSLSRSPVPVTPDTEYSSHHSASPRSPASRDRKETRANTSSPGLHRSKAQASVSREARDLATGFGEAFIDGQVRVARKRGDVTSSADDSGNRRSARLKPSDISHAEAPHAEVTMAKPHHIATSSSLGDSRVASTSTIADEVRKADNKLTEMYKQREMALSTLKPGQSAVVRHPKCPRSAAKHTVSVDAFGVPYTDFLAEPATGYWTQDTPSPSKSAPIDVKSGVVRPMPDRVRSSEATKAWAKKQKEHWCSCHKPDDGRDMVRCANEECLIGWYHVDCVSEENKPDADDSGEDFAESEHTESDEPEWVCDICMTYCQAGAKIIPTSSDMVEQMERLFAPPYASRVSPYNGGPYGLGLARTIPASENSISKQLAQLPQLDGPSDIPPRSGTPHPHKQHAPLAQPNQHFEIPASLLSSKHAPSPEELAACYPLALQFPQPSSPPHRIQSQTPGGPYTPDSTTSTGEWRHPPTRFQHLAAFVKAGNSLDENEKAAVEVWREASREQIEWEKYLVRVERERGMYDAGTDDDGGSNLVESDDEGGDEKEAEETEEGEIDKNGEAEPHILTARLVGAAAEQTADTDETMSEGKVGLSRGECRGKDLTAVLADVRSRCT